MNIAGKHSVRLRFCLQCIFFDLGYYLHPGDLFNIYLILDLLIKSIVY